MTTTPARYTAWAMNRRRQIAYGRWQPFVPVDEARALVDALRGTGLSVPSIAAAAGLPVSVVAQIAYVGYAQPRTKVRTETLDRLRAAHDQIVVRPGGPAPADLPPDSLIPATGTHRRIHALNAIGWTLGHIADHLGVTRQSVSRMTRSPKVTARTAIAIAAVYDTLWRTPGPSDTTRRRATAAGWVPPLAWDDDTIDDPAARPAGVDAVQGRRRREDLVEEAADLADLGEHLTTAAARLGITAGNLERTLYRAGRHDLVSRLKGRDTREVSA